MDASNFLKLSPLVRENLNVALKSIVNNKLRSILTILIIAVGITSLVGILTATSALQSEILSGFEKMGTTSFTIAPMYYQAQGETRSRVRNQRIISYRQAKLFKDNYMENALTSVYTRKEGVTVKFEGESSNPTISMIIADENYMNFANMEVAKGRGILDSDVNNNVQVCVLGETLARTLFKRDDNAIGNNISIDGYKLEVVGVLKGENSSMGSDNLLVVPISVGREFFIPESGYSFYIGVKPMVGSSGIAAVKDNAHMVMRGVRRLSPYDVSDFRINSNDVMLEELTNIMGIITVVAVVIGLITLLGAAVALMNIMLVSVKERTREIGTRKALGASEKTIKEQFLFESVVISQIGCLFGIVLGVSIGNIVASFMNVSYIIPWIWIFSAIVVCLIVGISSGYIPAVRASKLDPIEALRYE